MFFTMRYIGNGMEQNSPNRVAFLSLDPNTKYCLVDTMVLLPMYCGDLDVVPEAKRELNGATLVLLNKVVGEAAYKHEEMEGGKESYEEFASELSSRLESAGIASKFAWFDYEMSDFWGAMINDRTHPNLSKVDYALLCAAIERPNMDIMTDDKGLRGSIERERGADARGRILSATCNYKKRRWSVAWLIKHMLDGHIPKDAFVKWSNHGRSTEFYIGDKMVASVSGESTRVDLSSWVKSPTKRKTLESEIGGKIGERFRSWKPSRRKNGSAEGKKWYRRQASGHDAAFF